MAESVKLPYDFGLLKGETVTVTDLGDGLYEITRGDGFNWVESAETYTIGRYVPAFGQLP